MTRRHARATQAEITRALRAAGPERVVELLPDGTIRFVPDDGKKAPFHDIDAANDAADVVPGRLA